MASKSPTVFSNKDPHFQFPSKNQQFLNKSHSNCLKNSLLIVIILLLIPLFPSKKPDFITESILTQFWEIIYLLFIGIVVSYGLFGRKNTEKTENLRNDVYETDISNVSSIFYDGFGNVYGSDAQNGEKIESFVGKNETWCCQNSKSCFLDTKSSDVKPMNLPVRNLRSNVVVNDKKEVKVGTTFEGKRVCDAKVVKIRGVDARNGEKIESSVGKNEFWCCANSKSRFLDTKRSDVKPANMPVRNLRSSAVVNDKKEVKVSTKSEGKRVCDAKVVKIRGVVPKNLENRFEEVSGDSLIPWKSRSVKLEKGEKTSSFKSHCHFRPQSVGEIKFKHLNDTSSTFSSELESSKEERKWDFWQKSEDHLVMEASKNGVKRPFSTGSVLDVKRLNYGDLGEGSGVEKGEQGSVGSLGFEVKSPTLAKLLSRAKSVRTIKPNRQIMNEKGQKGTTFNKFEGLRVNPEVGGMFRVPKPKPILHDEGKEDIGHGSVTDLEDTRSVFDRSECEDDNETNLLSDAELGSEVDRKAGEFIAKIKAQIRLQKADSPVKGYGGW